MKSNVMLSLVVALSLTALLSWSSRARSEELRCNKDQSLCTTDRRDYVVGDQIAILNSFDQVVAKGNVEAIKGTKRILLINKKLGPIHKDDRVVLVDQDNTRPTTIETITVDHPVYEKPGVLSVGGGVGLATLRAGEGLPAYVFDGYAELRKWRGIRLIGGGSFIMAQGTATRNGGKDGISSTSMNINGIAVYPGIAYKFFEQYAISPKIEADLGAIFISGAVNGAAEDFDAGDYNSNMTNGVGLYGRLKGGLSYRMGGGWFVDGGASTSQIQNAMSTSLFAGAAKVIK